jgi:hypothetical protein
VNPCIQCPASLCCRVTGRRVHRCQIYGVLYDNGEYLFPPGYTVIGKAPVPCTPDTCEAAVTWDSPCTKEDPILGCCVYQFMKEEGKKND